MDEQLPEQPQDQPSYQDLLQSYSVLQEQVTKTQQQKQSYDNEWIKWISDIAENDNTIDLVDFITSVNWTDNQKKAVKVLINGTLTKTLSTTYLSGMNDYKLAIMDFELTLNKLILRTVRLDKDPDFELLISMVTSTYKLLLRRSKGGYLTDKIGTQRTEISVDERQRRDEHGFKERVMNKFTGH